ncbi:hypothetical protein NFI96_016578 [Prochilodus magdalenae]|nr:hypothetical protein NFI96_016578 [Prochilodus magdalenae]
MGPFLVSVVLCVSAAVPHFAKGKSSANFRSQCGWEVGPKRLCGHLKQILVASARKLKMGHHWVLQQDNDPKHVIKSSQKWLTRHKIKLLPWPS